MIRNIMRSRTLLFCLAATAVLIINVSLFGQTPTAEVTGRVTDPSGAVVGGVTITVTNTATNTQRVVQTNASGVYDVPALTPGTYSLKAELTGFQSQVRTNIELQVAQVAGVDITLSVGNVSESVEVSASAAALETESNAVGTVIENKRIEDLPLNGRNYLQLATLAPGVTTTLVQNTTLIEREGGQRAAFMMSVGGDRIMFNHFTLDGLENTDVNYMTYMFLPTVDALQEFKVESGIFPAEYGHNVIQINVTTKSGGNEFHGAGWDFLRNSDLDAKNYYDTHSLPIPGYRRNQFGGTLGGPIVKNKLFFFGAYEGLRQLQGLTQPATVPSTSWLQGNFSGVSTVVYDPLSRVTNAAGTSVVSSTPFPSNIIPASRIAPISTGWANMFLPPVATYGANDYVNQEASTNNTDQETIRADYALSSNNNFLARFSHASEFQYTPQNIPLTGQDINDGSTSGMLGWVRVFGPNKVNDLRVGVSLFFNSAVPEEANKVDVVAELGIPGLGHNPLAWGVPNIVFSDGPSTFGTPTDMPFINHDTVYQSSDNFSWVKGDHSFKFGGEFNRTEFNQNGASGVFGYFTFTGQYTNSGLAGASTGAANSVADYVLGNMSSALWQSQASLPIGAMRSSYMGAYFEDSWKVTSKLTVNYGIRWEYNQPWTDKYEHLINIAYAWNNSITPYYVRSGNGPVYGDTVPPAYPIPSQFNIVRNGQYGTGVQKPDYNNWGPRLGIAYSLNSKTVIRTGGGIFYAHDYSNGYFDEERNPPYSFRGTNTGNVPIPNLNWNNAILTNGTSGYYYANQYNDPTPRLDQWSFGIERQLTKSMALETDYVGSSGSYLQRQLPYDSPQPGPGTVATRRPFPQFNGTWQLENGSTHSSYDSLQIKLTQRLSHGFTLLSAFSYGKSIDNASGIRGGPGDPNPPNPYSPNSDTRGLSSFDFKYRWTNSLLYSLPVGKGMALLHDASRAVDLIVGGWQLGSIVTFQTGVPDTATCQSATNVQNTGTTCFPDPTGINPSLGSAASPTHFLNPAAFVDRLPTEPAYSFGVGARDTIIGPGLFDWDFSIMKNFGITENQKLQFRGEFFNVSNHPNFALPGVGNGSTTFGVFSSTITTSRQIQFGLKYLF